MLGIREEKSLCTGAVLWRDDSPSNQPQNILWGTKEESRRGEANAGFHRVIVQQPLPGESGGLWKEIQVLIEVLYSYCNVYWGKY